MTSEYEQDWQPSQTTIDKTKLSFFKKIMKMIVKYAANWHYDFYGVEHDSQLLICRLVLIHLSLDDHLIEQNIN